MEAATTQEATEPRRGPLPVAVETQTTVSDRPHDCEAAASPSPREEAPMDDEDAATTATPRASIFARAASTLASRASRVITLPRAKPKERPIEETESEASVQSEGERDAGVSIVPETTEVSEPATPSLPWQTRDEHGEMVDDAEVRQKILALSVFRSTYVDHPGGEEEYIFEYPRYVDIAKELLLCDPGLREMHRVLIPSVVDEIAFWRNFFLRCNAVRLELARSPFLPEVKATYSTYSAVASLQKLKRELYLRRRSSTEKIRRTILRPRNSSADVTTAESLEVELGNLDLDLDGEIDRELRKRRPSRAVAHGA